MCVVCVRPEWQERERAGGACRLCRRAMVVRELAQHGSIALGQDNPPGKAGQVASGQGPASAGAPFDANRAHMARVYDFWLGGKDNFAADRAVADQVAAAYPDIRIAVRAQRAFLARAVHFLVTQAGIRQFLDIGTGLPSANNTHQVAQAAAPQCRVVYGDNDPIVLNHARALLTSSPEGATAYIDADLRDTGPILER